MAVLKSANNKEMILTCRCGCDEGIRVKIDTDDDEYYYYQTYISGNWYKEQQPLTKKLKKIWNIIRNKDFYYSEICMNKDEFDEYRNWLNQFDGG